MRWLERDSSFEAEGCLAVESGKAWPMETLQLTLKVCRVQHFESVLSKEASFCATSAGLHFTQDPENSPLL